MYLLMMCEFGPMCTLFCDSELEHFTITPKFVYFAPCCRQKCTFFCNVGLDSQGRLQIWTEHSIKLHVAAFSFKKGPRSPFWMVGMILYIVFSHIFLCQLRGQTKKACFQDYQKFVTQLLAQTWPFLDKLWILAFYNKLKIILNLLSFAQAHWKYNV